MTRQSLIDFCLTFPAAYEDYPFDDITDPGKWTVLRSAINDKRKSRKNEGKRLMNPRESNRIAMA